MALRQYRPDQYEEYIPKEKQVSYQAYQTTKPTQQRIQELVFFVNVVLFAVLTVIATYVYLSLKIPAFFAMLFALPTGGIGHALIRGVFRLQLKQLKQSLTKR